MSSDNFQNQIAVVETGAIVQELSSLLQAKKPIVPFPEKRLPYDWSPGSRQINFLDLSHYQAIEEYCPLEQVITVQCGIKLHALQQFLTKNSHWLPVAYPDEQTSLLDVILTGNAGPTEIFAGGLRRHILGLTFILSNGVFAKSGGKVVKNVSGYDLTRFLIGSYGHFALPVKANLRLYTTPELTATVVANSDNLQTLLSVVRDILADSISFAYVDLFDKRLLFGPLGEFIGDKTAIPEKPGYCLVAQIYGDRITVDAEATIVKKFFHDANLEHFISTETDAQQKVLTGLTQIDTCLKSKTDHRHIVELTLGAGDFIRLYRSKDLSAFPFLYRPVSGRLLYCLNSLPEQHFLLVLLNEYAKKNDKPLTVSYSDEDYMRKVVNLGVDNSVGAEATIAIKQRLKEQFDADNLFNPFVDL